jgi:hypothetical protein
MSHTEWGGRQAALRYRFASERQYRQYALLKSFTAKDAKEKKSFTAKGAKEFEGKLRRAADPA